jgi:hypothetical protein
MIESASPYVSKSASELIPGGGSRLNDCLSVISGSGVGFEAKKAATKVWLAAN